MEKNEGHEIKQLTTPPELIPGIWYVLGEPCPGITASEALKLARKKLKIKEGKTMTERQISPPSMDIGIKWNRVIIAKQSGRSWDIESAIVDLSLEVANAKFIPDLGEKAIK